jgi:branched-chain amino acid transport system permease protein
MDAARLMGINERKVFRISFGLTSALAGIAALLITPFYYINPNAGQVFQLKSFVVVVLGGMGSIPGALAGGLLIGLFEAFASLALNVTYAQAIIYLLFLVILLVLPKGLMGRE